MATTSNAIRTEHLTHDGLRVYDLEPLASELWAVAGPEVDPATIDPDDLPEGFRWVTDEEWQRLTSRITCKCVADGSAYLFKYQDGTAEKVAVRKLEWSDGDESYEYYNSDFNIWAEVPEQLLWKAKKSLRPCEPPRDVA